MFAVDIARLVKTREQTGDGQKKKEGRSVSSGREVVESSDPLSGDGSEKPILSSPQCGREDDMGAYLGEALMSALLHLFFFPGYTLAHSDRAEKTVNQEDVEEQSATFASTKQSSDGNIEEASGSLVDGMATGGERTQLDPQDNGFKEKKFWKEGDSAGRDRGESKQEREGSKQETDGSTQERDESKQKRDESKQEREGSRQEWRGEEWWCRSGRVHWESGFTEKGAGDMGDVCTRDTMSQDR